MTKPKGVERVMVKWGKGMGQGNGDGRAAGIAELCGVTSRGIDGQSHLIPPVIRPTPESLALSS